MPKLKKSEDEIKDNTIKAVLEYGMKMQGINVSTLSLISGIPVPTLYKRMQKPSTMRIGEARILCNKLKITDDMKEKLINGL